MQTILKSYIRRDKNSPPHGMVVAVRTGDEVHYGYSLINDRLDNWDKELGLKIALARANAEKYKLPQVPDRETMVLDALMRIQNRAKKYFKDIPVEAVVLSENFDHSME